MAFISPKTLKIPHVTEAETDYIQQQPGYSTLIFNSDFNYVQYQDSVFNFIQLAKNPEVVHLSGDETITGVKSFSSTITGNISGNASTVTTNANLTGVITSIGNATSITNLAITNAMIANATINLTAKVTGILPNANTTATNANTAGAIVTRDGSGDFSAGTITANLNGVASTATFAAGLAIYGTGVQGGTIITTTTGSINQAYLIIDRGDVAFGSAFLRYRTAGTTDYTVGTFTPAASWKIRSSSNADLFAIDQSGIVTLPNLTASQAVVTDGSKNLVSLAYASANTVSALVQRDGSGNFSAGTITASLSGNASTVTTNANLTGDVTSVGNAATVVKINGATLGTTTATSNYILIANGSSWVANPMAGDVTIAYPGTTAIGANKVLDTMIRQSAGLSMIGRSANTTGNVADITAASDNQVLRRSGTSIAFGAVNLASSSAVTGVLPNANTTATDANTASAIIARDASGNFIASQATFSVATSVLGLNVTADLTNTTGILVYPLKSPTLPVGNDGGRIFFKEDTSGTSGFSVSYNGGANNEILNIPSNTFAISRHNSSATGLVSLSIARTGGMTVVEPSTFSDATASTTTTTGAVIITGGAGIGGAVNIGTTITAANLKTTSTGSTVLNTAAIATNATDGFLYIASCAGTPTGVPTTNTGRVAMVYDTSANKIWFYNGSWRGVVVI